MRGVGRVAVVDWDVHHGNGTQAVFWEDASVLAISLHQDGLYPAQSGSLDESGPARRGTTLNVPLPAGSGTGAYLDAVDRVVVPALDAFAPELIVIACGFDAGALDPLGRMLLPAAAFGAMTERLLAAAARICDGRVVASHEGGYSAGHVPFCGLAVIEALSGLSAGVDDPFAYLAEVPGQDAATTPGCRRGRGGPPRRGDPGVIGRAWRGALFALRNGSHPEEPAAAPILPS